MLKLSQGDKAPDFFGNNQNGKQISLLDFKGKKLVLYFYPKDNTPGCTNQACNLSCFSLMEIIFFNSFIKSGFFFSLRIISIVEFKL